LGKLFTHTHTRTCTYTRASVIEQYMLVPGTDKRAVMPCGWEVIVGLVLHWPYITDISGLST